MRRFIYFISYIFVLIALGCAVQYIPYKKSNYMPACSIFKGENYYPSVAGRVLDNYTDAAMMIISPETGENQTAFTKFISSQIYTVYQQDSDHWIDLFPIESLCRDDLPHYLLSYSRYWHGYQIITKPLFYFTDYRHIRQGNLYLQVLLFGFIVYLMWLKSCKGLIPGWLLSYLIFNPEAMPMNMTYSILYYVTVLVIILMLTCRRFIADKLGWPLFFATVGVTTCFFDYLTYPIVPIAVGLTILFYFEPPQNFKEMCRRLFILLTAWWLGYVGFWLFKWILAALVTEQNIFSSAFESVMRRMTPKITVYENQIMEEQNFPIGYALISTLKETMQSAEANLAVKIICTLSVLPLFYHLKQRLHFAREKYFQLLVFVLIASLIVIYCVVVSGHPLQHSSFTYRLWVAFFFPMVTGINFWLTNSLRKKHEED